MLALLLSALLPTTTFDDDAPLVPVGLAKMDITPATPIRLTGYGSRTAESDGIEQPLWARAIALGDDTPAVLVTLDVCGVPATLVDEAAHRLETAVQLPRERLAVCVTHTHTGPAVLGYAPMIFADDPTPAEQQHIEDYSRHLVDAITRVAVEAIKAREPAHLGHAAGSVDFAVNRRVVRDAKWTGFGVSPDASVDRSLPLLRVTDRMGALRAVVAGYACHCTTLEGDFNRICGDWAGYACERLEADRPGVQAMVLIGCAADANPEPRGQLDQAKQHGQAVAAEVHRLLGGAFADLPSPTSARLERIDLDFAPIPPREHWEAEAKKPAQAGRRGRSMLATLDLGRPLPTTLPYTIQTWTFGDRLAFVFLAGEVVVDYAARLRADLTDRRLWPVAYANDVPCYIPSRRILDEGGYEAVDSMTYYNRPAPLAPSTEDRIVEAVTRLLRPTRD